MQIEEKHFMSVKAHNAVKQLNFAGPHIHAELVESVESYHIQERTIVINPHMANVYVGGELRKPIPPMSSTILENTCIEKAASLILLQVKEEANIGNIILESGWDLYGNLVKKMPGKDKSFPYPKNTPLWRSPQDDAGSITFDPSVVLD